MNYFYRRYLNCYEDFLNRLRKSGLFPASFRKKRNGIPIALPLICLLVILILSGTLRAENSFTRQFQTPPGGFGEVPFWWLSGEKLDSDRLAWQIEELHKKGIPGVQINYCHEDSPGWPTFKNDPEIFTEDWWRVFEKMALECRKRGMGIGLSGYTIDWQNSPTNLFARIIYNDEEINSRNIQIREKWPIKKGRESIGRIVAKNIDDKQKSNASSLNKAENVRQIDSSSKTTVIAAIFYPKDNGKIVSKKGINLLASTQTPAGKTEWRFTAESDGEIWIVEASRVPNTLNPLHPLSGQRVIDRFFQPFEDRVCGTKRNVPASVSGLNYFFQDELQLGTGDLIWHDDLATEFQKRKGYPLIEALPALFGTDLGNMTEKYLLDFRDVRVRMAEERYFIPIFNWHNSRQMIYACDPGSRGRNPNEFGDYFSAVRWYTAPGHDTPGGHADFIKNKVSSSIAHFYKRPRVWLEGYHSFGWGAAPEQLFFATCENYLFGANLLNLHGLYYTTYGGFWEWAPPCYHFRMPYWNDFGGFLKYFERLSWIMTQGVQQVDTVVLYPVTPGQADPKQTAGASAAAFEAAQSIFGLGHDLLFIDDDSIARATVEKGTLCVAGGKHRVLLLPNMTAIRYRTLQKALEFYRAGGTVLAYKELPAASDRAGRNDPEVKAILTEIFGASEYRSGTLSHKNEQGGLGLASFDWPTLEKFFRSIPYDVIHRSDSIQAGAIPDGNADNIGKGVRIQHRRTAERDIYMLMGIEKDRPLTLRASGKVELFNCFDGTVREIPAKAHSDGTMTLSLPFGPKEAVLLVFSRNEKPSEKILPIVRFEEKSARELNGNWEFETIPTLDNRYGDFRLPVKQKIIGPEAQRFLYCETKPEASEKPAAIPFNVFPNEAGKSSGLQKQSGEKFDNAKRQEYKIPDFKGAPKVLCGFGQKFWKLGPLPVGTDLGKLESELVKLKRIDPSQPVKIKDAFYFWTPYSFSWRFGIEGNPGHQGFHGLKERIDNRFIGLGAAGNALNETTFIPEKNGSIYYLWTTVAARPAQTGSLIFETEGAAPNAVYLAGHKMDPTTKLEKNSVPVPLLIRYDRAGRYAFTIASAVPPKFARTPLAMKWYDNPTRLEFDPFTDEDRPICWYQFTAPPGMKKCIIKSNAQECRIVSGTVESSTMKEVVLRVKPKPGCYGGAVFTDPIQLICEAGLAPLGNWNEFGALETFSGTVRYSKEFELSPSEAKGRVLLSLGTLCASARVVVNGTEVGVLFTPPWTIEISKYIKSGANRIEIRVSNTLSNFYSTLPSRYKGNSPSGLIGPVKLLFGN